MAMNVFSLKAILGLDSSEYEKGLGDAKSKATSIGSAIGNGLKTAVGVGVKAVAAATTAVTAFGGASVKVGQEFDKSMSQVAATMGLTMNEMENQVGSVELAWGTFSGNLREYAQEMGKNTAFSATEAADALNYMALAGYDVQTSMQMLPNVLNLAAAGSMDLARASDMVTDTQTAFGISLERTSQMVDEMAKAASTGNTSVEQLGDAFLVVGGLAQELNGGFINLEDGSRVAYDNVQELEIALTAMANAGIKGSEAGTHMRNMLLKLASPTDDGYKAFTALGVSVFDAEGKMRSLSSIMEDLDAGLSELSQEEKLQAISDIFNTRDTAAAEALLNAVGDDWASIAESILDADGAAQQMADTQLDNLAGDITLMKSALEGFQIAISDGATPVLRDFVQLGTRGLSDLTTIFSKFDASQYVDEMGRMTQEGAMAQAEFKKNREAAVNDLFQTVTDGINIIAETLPTMVNTGMQLLGAIGRGILDNLPVIIDAAVQIVTQLTVGLAKALPQLARGAITLIKSLGEAFAENSGELMAVGEELLTMLWEGITTGLPMLAQGAAELLTNLGTYLQEQLPILLPTILNMIMEFSASLRENAGLLVDGALSLIMGLAHGLIDSLPVMIQTIPTIVSNIAGIINDNAPKLIATGIELIGQLVIGIVEAIPTIIEEFPKIVQAIFDVLMAVNWINLGSSIITGIKNGITALAQELPTTLQNIGTQAVEWLKTIQWSTLGRDIIDLIIIGIKALLNAIPNLLQTIGRNAIGAFKNIDWIGLGKFLVTGIVSGISNAAHLFMDAIGNLAKSAWDSITSFFKVESPSKRMMWVGEMLDAGLAKGISNMAYMVDDAMQDLSAGIMEVTPQLALADGGTISDMSGTGYNQVVNIYSPTALTPSEVARQTRNATRDMVLNLRGKR